MHVIKTPTFLDPLCLNSFITQLRYGIQPLADISDTDHGRKSWKLSVCRHGRLGLDYDRKQGVFEQEVPLEPVVKIHHKLAIILDHKILLREPPSTRNTALFVLKSKNVSWCWRRPSKLHERQVDLEISQLRDYGIRLVHLT